MKKSIFKIITTSIIALILTVSTSYGASGEQYVRVRIRSPRLYNEQSSLQGYEDIKVYEKNERPREIFTLDEDSVSVLIDGFYDGNYNYLTDDKKAVHGSYHVALEDVFESYNEANEKVKKLEKSFDSDFYAHYSKDGYKIFAGFYTNHNDAERLLEKLSNDGYDGDIINGYLKNVVVYNDYNDAVFMYSNDLNIFFSTYNYDESSDMIKIDGRPYRGLMGFKIIDNDRLISINYVELESYLYGVVPNEISASWGLEALKAQAVAARTYAVSCLNPYASYGYDLEDNQNSQVYRGYNSEKQSTNKAVDETRGEMIYYNDKLIQAFYHSTSGGSTENSENVWSAKLPYAVGVKDEFSNRSGSPYNEWKKSYDKSEIIKKLKDDGHPVKELYSIEITKVSENNRVMECIFLTDIGEIVYKKENARLLLGLMSSWFTIENGSVFYFTNENTIEIKEDNSSEDQVPSRGGILDLITDDKEVSEIDANKLDSGSIVGKYVITSDGNVKITKEKVAVIDSKGITILDTNTSRYNFEGRGWGHGIGMSQYGAKQMAAEGYTYDEILKHYYTGVTIK